jgi:hypothetical protein
MAWTEADRFEHPDVLRRRRTAAARVVRVTGGTFCIGYARASLDPMTPAFPVRSL